MRKIINECVQCDLPCIDCGRKHVERLFCDRCRAQISRGYHFEGEDYCEYCLLDVLIKRYFDTRETIENFINAMNNKWNNSYFDADMKTFSYNELIDALDVSDLNELIEYLGISAYAIEE